MTQPLSIEQRRAEALRSLDLLAPLMLFMTAAMARLIMVVAVSYPGLDDPAFYLLVAENLAHGRGLVIDVLWNYQFPFDTVTHPSNEHWMPLASLLMAPLFAVFGSNFQLAQTQGALLGAALAPIAWRMTREVMEPLGSWRGYAAFAGALIAINPLLVYQSVSADSSTPFAISAAVALWWGAERANRSRGFALAAGLSAGLAYLARTEGLLLLGLLIGWVAWRAAPQVRWRQLALVALGGLAMTAPWWLRNLTAFGAAMPSSALALAMLPDYPAMFHYGPSGFWDAFPFPNVGEFLVLRLQGLGHNLTVLFVVAMFVVSLFAVVAAIRLRRSPVVTLGGTFGALLFFLTALVFPVPTQNGTFYHSVGAVLPVLAVAGASGLYRSTQILGQRLFRAPGFTGVMTCIAVTVLLGVQFALAVTASSDFHGGNKAYLLRAAEWLHEAGVAGPVMTTQPYSLRYASGLSTIALPAGDPPTTARQAAERYGARYIAGFGRFGRYPQALQGTPGFTEMLSERGLWIFRID
ncbi:MAG: hypothetical protein EXR51_11445 [Dehalococcoidia bacterium]|nr:hypothetical protein [Dehalococcoidia bacterium]